MKHITPERLDDLEDLLLGLRKLNAFKEKNRGVFYRNSKAFLHFHEDPAGLFADVRLTGADFDRHRVSTRAEQQRLLRRVIRAVRKD